MPHLLPFLLLAIGSTDPAEATVTLVSGDARTGVVESWDAQSVRLNAGDATHDLAANEVLHIRWSRDAAPAAAADQPAASIELIDGARLRYDEFTVADRVAAVTAPLLAAPASISTEKIRRVDLQPPSPASEAAWRQLEQKEVTGDVLVVAQRDGESMDYLTGIVGNVTADQTEFKWDGEQIAVKRAKIAGIEFYHARVAAFPAAVCQLTTVDGSSIPARTIALAQSALEVTTPAGISVSIPLDQVVAADFSAGKLAFLSDLKPTESRWTPLIATPAGAQIARRHGEPRNDLSFAGSALTLLWKDDPLPDRRDIRTYAKGLALRSRTELTYRLPDKMRRFRTVAGIDPLSASQGHVELEILGDDRVLWQGEIDGQRPPVEIDVELGSARRLQIRVDYGKNLDYGDRLHLVEASVTK